MNVAILTTISKETPWAEQTIPNTVNYCKKHGYSFFIINAKYQEVLEISRLAIPLLDVFDFVWCIDSDVVITNHQIKIEDLEISNGLNVCLEGLWDGNKYNCGSVIYRGEEGKKILKIIADAKPQWERMMFFWQQWLNEKIGNDGEVSALCKVHPIGTFNSCHCNGTNLWKEGHFVYHPCGTWPGMRIGLCKKAVEAIKQSC